MSLWSMPEEVVVALRHQSNPGYSGEYHEYPKLIFVAQRLLYQHNIGRGPKLEIPEQIFEELHLDPEKARTTVTNIIESEDELKHIALQLTPH